MKLKEKEMTDTQRLTIKVERLEEKIKELQKNCQLQVVIERQEQRTKQLEEEVRRMKD